MEMPTVSASRTMQSTGKSIHRCPACGHRIDDSETPKCPLCSFEFGGRRVTGDDVTPYAQSFQEGSPGWRRMLAWVAFASSERLKHLALMRASAASRRFALMHILLLGFAAGVFQASELGWRWVSSSAAVEPSGSMEPKGFYWRKVASAPRPLPADNPDETPVDLWWNYIQFPIVLSLGSTTAMLLTWFWLRSTRRGIQRSHRPPFDEERRMSAAVHYCMAWSAPVALGLFILGLRPMAYVGAMAQWSWHPPRHVFEVSAAVLCGLGFALGWFWLIRMAASAPARTRRSVMIYAVFGIPVLAMLCGSVWYFGLGWAYGPMFRALKLAF